MWTGIGVLVAVASLAAAGAATAQPSPKPPANGECLTCHGDAMARRDNGQSIAVDAKLFEGSTHGGKACIDCHSEVIEVPHAEKLAPVNCGTCHAESLQTYRDTFHGQVTALGFVSVATCADCHGAHDIHARTDARSSVSAGRLVETCQRCHQGANANFVKYDPHANRYSRARNPGLYYAGRFMDVLLFTVFGFFGLHTALWCVRGLVERKHARRPRAPQEQ